VTVFGEGGSSSSAGTPSVRRAAQNFDRLVVMSLTVPKWGGQIVGWDCFAGRVCREASPAGRTRVPILLGTPATVVSSLER
jgi:hypothetical protein